MTTVNAYAFLDCNSLKTITFGNTVTSLGTAALSGCAALEEIYSLNPNPPLTSSNTFDYINKATCKLYVPEGAYSAYWVAEGWGDFANILTVDTHVTNPQQTGVKVTTEENEIVISDTEAGANITIYTTSGAMLTTLTANGNEQRISLPAGTLYFVKVGDKTFKVAL